MMQLKSGVLLISSGGNKAGWPDGLYETPLLIQDGAAILDLFAGTSIQPLHL